MIATLGHDLRACATALFCSWAVAAACGAPRSSVSTSCATTTAMAPAGSRFLTARAAGHPARQDRLARGRGRLRLQRPHLPRSRARELDPLWPHRTWTPVRRIFKDNKTVDVERLSDKHVARLVKQVTIAAGVPSDLPEG